MRKWYSIPHLKRFDASAYWIGGELRNYETGKTDRGPGMSIVRCAVDELIKFSKESEVLKYMKFFFEQNIAEERHSVNAIREYDSLESLKELKEVENDKLIALNNMIFEIEEKIRLMEGHVQEMEEAIMSVHAFMLMLGPRNRHAHTFLDLDITYQSSGICVVGLSVVMVSLIENIKCEHGDFNPYDRHMSTYKSLFDVGLLEGFPIFIVIFRTLRMFPGNTMEDNAKELLKSTVVHRWSKAGADCHLFNIDNLGDEKDDRNCTDSVRNETRIL
ncbi:hypothetical protein Tco_0032729 [Tanacetum coccineum]